MAKHLNPLEKEFLIRTYRSNQAVKINDFCEKNSVSVGAFKKWLKQYEEGGLEGLARADTEIGNVLPEGIDRTVESYKREILKLRIENERLKKTILFGRTKLGNRLIQIAIGFPLTVEDTQYLLRLGGYSELYVRNSRDAYIMFALEKRYGITETNELLFKNGKKILE